MVITITPEIEELVNEQVKSGEFSSPSEVLLESLRLLKARRESIAKLRQAIQLGVDDMRKGRFTTYHTAEELDALAEEIINEGMERRNQAQLQQCGE